MNGNPISLHHSGRITDAQLDSCNMLLTQLAALVDQLEKLISPINHIEVLSISAENTAQQSKIAERKKALLSPLQANWHYILIDIKTVVLPEFYVVFNDPTTLATARRRLYDMAQAIYYAFKRYLDSSLYAHDDMEAENFTDSKSAEPSIADNKAIGLDTSYTVGTGTSYRQLLQSALAPDSYVSKKGNKQGSNASIAAELHELAQFVDVDGMNYIEEFDPYYSALIERDKLQALLQAHSKETLAEQLVRWQQARLTSFGIISAQTKFQNPSILNSRLNHNLAKRLLSDVLGLSYPTVSTVTTDAELQANLESELILQPEQFKKGAALSLFGLGSAGLISISPVLGVVLFLFSIFAAIMSTKLLFPAVNFRRYHEEIGNATSYAMWISFFALFLGTPWTFIAVYVLCIASWTKTHNREQQAPRLNQLTVTNNSKTAANQLALKPSEPINPTDTLSLNIHAYHLGLLLSDEPTERLLQLLLATNELNEHLEYLQSTYPYLATRVGELIKDLKQNIIARLDELASRFVENGAVNPEVQALFIRQHQARIDDLLTLSLKQVRDLNTTILEKKMAIFDEVGNQQEQLFRNAVMELKILLRWLVAQQPDELTASSHQVILDNLESTTLKQMQKVFFDNQTNNDQRQALLVQVEELLAHFRQQSPYSLDVNSALSGSAEQELELSNLLNLSENKEAQSVTLADPDDQQAQTQAQDFVKFNQAYINELVKYWH